MIITPTHTDNFVFEVIRHAQRAPTPACPAYAEAASRRQAKRPHFGAQARMMKMIARNESHEW
jgi:hypothetical protein